RVGSGRQILRNLRVNLERRLRHGSCRYAVDRDDAVGSWTGQTTAKDRHEPAWSDPRRKGRGVDDSSGRQSHILRHQDELSARPGRLKCGDSGAQVRAAAAAGEIVDCDADSWTHIDP